MTTRKETPWSIVVGIAAFLAQVMAGGLVGTSGFYYPHFEWAFQSSGAATSWLCSMTLFGWFVGNSIGSIVVNRFGYRLCAVVGGLVSSLGLSLCLIVDNIYLAFLCYGVLGCIGNGVHGMAFIVAIIDYFDKHRRTVQILATVGSGIGFAVYSTLIPIVIANVGWQGCIFLQGGVALNVCVLGMLLFERESAQKEKPKRLSLNVSLLFNVPVFLFCIHGFLVTCCESAYFVHLPVLILSKGFSVTDAALAFLCYSICNAVAKVTYSVPWRVDPMKLYTITMFVYGIAALCQPFVTNLVAICIFSGVSGFTANCFSGYTIVVILELAGVDNYTDVHGIVYMFRAVGAITIGPVAGFLYDATNRYENVFFLIASLMTTACLLMIPILIGRRRIAKSTPTHEEANIEPCQEDLIPMK